LRGGAGPTEARWTFRTAAGSLHFRGLRTHLPNGAPNLSLSARSPRGLSAGAQVGGPRFGKGKPPMNAMLGTSESMAEPLRAFLAAEGIALTVVTDDDCTVRVAQSEDRQPSTPKVIQAGGWITCPLARSMARKLRITTPQIGQLLNHLDVKIRGCELGCFP
jgi:hypothetical protein